MLQTVFDLSEFIKVVSDGFAFAQQLELYFAKIDPVGLADVERQLIYDLKPTGNSRIAKHDPGIKLTHDTTKCANYDLRADFKKKGIDAK